MPTDLANKATTILMGTGMTRDKPEKKWTVENRWLPAINAIRARHGWPRWAFMEVARETDVADFRNLLLKKLGHA